MQNLPEVDIFKNKFKKVSIYDDGFWISVIINIDFGIIHVHTETNPSPYRVLGRPASAARRIRLFGIIPILWNVYTLHGSELIESIHDYRKVLSCYETRN